MTGSADPQGAAAALAATLAAAKALGPTLRAACDLVASLADHLELALASGAEAGVNGSSPPLPPSDPPPDAPAALRRDHRPGRAPKIASDPELEAFVAARVDTMTFHQLEAAVAAAFPPARRVGKSAIHASWAATRGPRRRR
jgi:hypothetical protein